MMIPDYCPGSVNLRTPTLSIKNCPRCGEEIEIFSDEIQATCSNCGFIIFSDFISCIKWCKYARECVGEDIYNRLMSDRTIS